MNTKLLQLNSIFTLSSLIILLLHSTSILAQHQPAFDYIKGTDIGPEKWGELTPDWAACKWGTTQSPIDISTPTVGVITGSKGIQRNYKPQNASVNNEQEYMMTVQWEGDAGSILINDREIGLRQVHWHAPSEHTINGRRYDMESHMVHRSPDNRTTVVIAHLYEFGYPDYFLSQLDGSISSLIGKKGEKREAGVMNPMEMDKVSDESYSYYNYDGSLTMPPCSEGVNWIVSKKISTVSREQVKLLLQAIKNNGSESARPLQPRSNRRVRLYYQKGRKY